MAAVDKIKDQRKPDDFIGYRNRTPTPTGITDNKECPYGEWISRKRGVGGAAPYIGMTGKGRRSLQFFSSSARSGSTFSANGAKME